MSYRGTNVDLHFAFYLYLVHLNEIVTQEERGCLKQWGGEYRKKQPHVSKSICKQNIDNAVFRNYILYSSFAFPSFFKHCSLSFMSIFSSPHDDSCYPMCQGHLFWDYNLTFLVSHHFTNSQKSAQPSNHNSYNKAIDHFVQGCVIL